jgi:hypothetical protein
MSTIRHRLSRRLGLACLLAVLVAATATADARASGAALTQDETAAAAWFRPFKQGSDRGIGVLLKVRRVTTAFVDFEYGVTKATVVDVMAGVCTRFRDDASEYFGYGYQCRGASLSKEIPNDAFVMDSDLGRASLDTMVEGWRVHVSWDAAGDPTMPEASVPSPGGAYAEEHRRAIAEGSVLGISVSRKGYDRAVMARSYTAAIETSRRHLFAREAGSSTLP